MIITLTRFVKRDGILLNIYFLLDIYVKICYTY